MVIVGSVAEDMIVVSAAEENIVSVMSDPKKITEAMNTPMMMSTLYLNFMLICQALPAASAACPESDPFFVPYVLFYKETVQSQIETAVP